MSWTSPTEGGTHPASAEPGVNARLFLRLRLVAGPVDDRHVEVRAAADAADEGQLDGGIERVDAEGEPEHVELEAFDAACGHAEEPGERKLLAAAAGRAVDYLVAQVVLADRGRRQVDLELRHRARD